MSAPRKVEIATAGTVISTEFQTKGSSPSQRTPTQAAFHALAQAAKDTSRGRLMREPSRISSSDFSEVEIITTRGMR